MAVDVIVLNNLGGGQSCQVDQLPHPGDTVKGYNWQPSIDAGKGPNACVAMARLGVHPAFVGKAGKDPAGDRGEKWMREAGVDTSGLLRTDKVMTGQGIRIVEKSGNNLIVCGESSSRALTTQEVEREIERLQPAGYFYGGFEIREELVLAGLRKAKNCGMTTIVNLSPIPSEPVGKLDCADYLIINETEAAMVCGLSSWKELPMKRLAQQVRDKLGCGCVIITLGENGCIGLRVSPVKVDCVDTSGAGDAFLSAVIVNLIWGKDIEDACKWAGAYASYTTMRRGTLLSYPMLEEVQGFVSQHIK